LFVGCRVRLLANIAVQLGLYNGATGNVVAICFEKAFRVDASVETAASHRLPVPILLVQMDVYNGTSCVADIPNVVPIVPTAVPFRYKGISGTRTQLPIELAFCSTIHKVQGFTLKALLADTSGCFEFGPAYVAISRCKVAEELRLLSPLTVEQLRHKIFDRGGKLCTLAAGIVAEEQRLQLLHTDTMAFAATLPAWALELSDAEIAEAQAQQQVVADADADAVVAPPLEPAAVVLAAAMPESGVEESKGDDSLETINPAAFDARGSEARFLKGLRTRIRQMPLPADFVNSVAPDSWMWCYRPLVCDIYCVPHPYKYICRRIFGIKVWDAVVSAYQMTYPRSARPIIDCNSATLAADLHQFLQVPSTRTTAPFLSVMQMASSIRSLLPQMVVRGEVVLTEQ
jgi:hypothetical protein